MEHRIPLEKKMELAQYIREENMGNRMKIRQREKILYGTNSQPPLYEKGMLANQIMQQNDTAGSFEDGGMPNLSLGTFKYRMIIAVLLFVGFLVCDTNDSKIGNYSMNDVHDMIVADSFHLYEGEGNETMEGLASLLDFGE
ncbi:MAG: hypothetical protein J6K48_09305 [Lachnospiraceae bacterium]|nr:hypothetical protein [Lachnospiraceae bacterium]